MTPRPWIMRCAFVLLWAFVFTMPFEKSVEVPGLGTVSKLFGLIAVAGGFIAVFSQQRLRLPSKIHLGLAVFVLWTAFTTLWSWREEYTIERSITYVQLFTLLWLIWELCPEEIHVMSLLEAYIVGTLVPISQTLQRFVSGKQTYYNRYAIEGFDPNDLALTLALSVPMAIYLSLRYTGLRSWLYRGQLAATIGTIFLTGSRGGTLSMLIGMSLIAWTFRTLPVRQKASVVLALAITAGGAIAVVPAASWARLATVGSEISEGTLNSRTVLWSAGWKAFTGAPVQGIGAGAYPETTVEAIGRPWAFVAVAHNSFLSILVETGAVGFTIFMIIFATLVVTAYRMPGLSKLYWCTQLGVWTFGVLSLTWEYRKPTWLLFGLLIAHAAAVRRSEVPGEDRQPARAMEVRLA